MTSRRRRPDPDKLAALALRGVEVQAGRGGVADDPPRRPSRPVPGHGRGRPDDRGRRWPPAPGCNERWLLEWLRGQAAAGLLDTADGELFELSPEAAAVLADETGSLWFAAGAFQGGVAPPDVVDRLADAFRTGIGLSYDDLGPSAAHGSSACSARGPGWRWCPGSCPALDGVVERLATVPGSPTSGAGRAWRCWPWPPPSLTAASTATTRPRHAIAPGPGQAGGAGLTNVELPRGRGGRPARPSRPSTSSWRSTASTTCPSPPRRSPPSGGPSSPTAPG